MRTTRPLAAMLAVTLAAFAVPTAHAQRTGPAQADMHASVALAAAAASQQDLRGADAQDAAVCPRTNTATAGASSQPRGTLVAGMQPAAPASSTDDGDTANGLGALAGLIVIGLACLYTRRHRRAVL